MWLVAALVLAACASPSREELLAGKECTPAPALRCAAGYTCDLESRLCVPDGEAAGGGTSTGGVESGGGESGAGATVGAGGSVPGTGGGGTGGGGPGGGGGVDLGGTGGGDLGGTGGGDLGGTGGVVGFDCNATPANCDALSQALRHRYQFEGAASLVLDYVGAANGTASAGAVHANGEVALAGGAYVDFPNGIVSELVDATLELWVVWNGGADGQRILDFGDVVSGSVCTAGGTAASEGQPGVCQRTSIYVTPSALTGIGAGGLRAAVQTVEQSAAFPTTTTVVQADSGAASPLPVGSVEHLAVVVDDGVGELRVYHNGARVDADPFPGHLADLGDINNWLGQAQTATRPAFDGSILEFRIYGEALTDEQVATSFAAGTDAAFLN
jgi:hypothetical protein